MAMETKLATKAHLYSLLVIKYSNPDIVINGLDKEISRIKAMMEQDDVKVVEANIATEYNI
jgi:hypothetical protein